MMSAVDGMHNSFKVVLCFMHATPSHYRHYADLLTCIEHIRWEILDAYVYAFWVFSVEM